MNRFPIYVAVWSEEVVSVLDQPRCCQDWLSVGARGCSAFQPGTAFCKPVSMVLWWEELCSAPASALRVYGTRIFKDRNTPFPSVARNVLLWIITVILVWLEDGCIWNRKSKFDQTSLATAFRSGLALPAQSISWVGLPSVPWAQPREAPPRVMLCS